MLGMARGSQSLSVTWLNAAVRLQSADNLKVEKLDTPIAEFTEVVGARHVLVDADLRSSYETDWTGRYKGATPCVVRPGSAIEVARILEICSKANCAVVPQGGNTGLVGGSVPVNGEVVLSSQRLNVISDLDLLSSQVTVGAGVKLADLQNEVKKHGLEFGVDLAARDSATIGGMVATNAGGIHVVRHGSMRAQVIGIEAVLADGRIASHLRGLPKDNTGYDIEGLMVGSEGTLGFVTRVRLKLMQRTPELVLAMVGLSSVEDAVTFTARLRASSCDVRAIELLTKSTIELVSSHMKGSPPLKNAHVALLIEVVGEDEAAEELAEVLEAQAPDIEAVVATGPAGQLRLWQYRENATEAIARAGDPRKLDVSLPMANIAEFVRRVEALVVSYESDARAYLFGHLGDGNLHVNVLGVKNGAALDRLILELVASLEGSISAEHGIGRTKRDDLPLTRSPDEISMFRSIKQGLDPLSIMNPNVLLPA